MPAPPPPPKGTCEQCRAADTNLFELQGTWLCANDYRDAVRKIKVQQACDKCGGQPAFRDPSHRRNEYLCVTCHAEVGYVLQDQGMLKKLDRVGKIHPLGRQDPCLGAGQGTPCRGQVKPRGKFGVLCDFHYAPTKYAARKG